MLGIVQHIRMGIPKLGARIAWIQVFWKYHYLNGVWSQNYTGNRCFHSVAENYHLSLRSQKY